MNTLNFTGDTRFALFFRKFTNLIMKNGKKIKASKLLFEALLILKKRLQKEGEKKNYFSQKEITVNLTVLRVVFLALENITPNQSIALIFGPLFWRISHAN